MIISVRERELLARLAWIIALSAGSGAAYGAAVTSGTVLVGVLTGVLTGATIGAACGGFEIFYVSRRRGEGFRRLPFAVHLALRTGFYAAVIVGGIWVWAAAIFDAPTRWRVGDREFLLSIGFAFAVALAFNFVLSTQRMMGRGVMASYLSGRYYQPREEERIFMFLDIVGSTEIAERIGHLRFHKLLNRFCFDISEPIAATRGEIHKYVGDGIIITWPMQRGVQDANCVRCYFDLKDTLESASDGYLREFGVAPKFRVGLHAGTVVTGELGDSKQEIAFLGDTVNTAARIEELCRDRNQDVLVSHDLLSRLEMPPQYLAESLGTATLRGKTEPVELFTLTRAD